MAQVINKGNLFPAKIMSELLTGIKGHSSLAKMANSEPLPISGKEYLTFNVDGEANIVGEGENKPAGGATVAAKVMNPIKLVLNHRISDEFLYATSEDRIPYLQQVIDAYEGKCGRALDIAAIAGINPGNGQDASFKATNSFEGTATIKKTTPTDGAIDEALDAGIAEVNGNGFKTNGVIFSPAGASAMGAIKANGIAQYPEFKFGSTPERFYGHLTDTNDTVDFVTADKNLAIAGDFNQFKWAVSKAPQFTVIEYGDPDGLGDLRRMNQVCLRTEIMLGWLIVDPTAFTVIKGE